VAKQAKDEKDSRYTAERIPASLSLFLSLSTVEMPCAATVYAVLE
jgi:hypothetical protein